MKKQALIYNKKTETIDNQTKGKTYEEIMQYAREQVKAIPKDKLESTFRSYKKKFDTNYQEENYPKNLLDLWHCLTIQIETRLNNNNQNNYFKNKKNNEPEKQRENYMEKKIINMFNEMPESLKTEPKVYLRILKKVTEKMTNKEAQKLLKSAHKLREEKDIKEALKNVKASLKLNKTIRAENLLEELEQESNQLMFKENNDKQIQTSNQQIH